MSIAIVDNAYAAYLAGPTQITLTTAWQRFKIAGTLAAGQTGLWIVMRQFDGNGDDWTSGSILLWGACLQQGNDPKKGYARTWGYQVGIPGEGERDSGVIANRDSGAKANSFGASPESCSRWPGTISTSGVTLDITMARPPSEREGACRPGDCPCGNSRRSFASVMN